MRSEEQRTFLKGTLDRRMIKTWINSWTDKSGDGWMDGWMDVDA